MELSRPSSPNPVSSKLTDQTATKSCFICFETAEETPGQPWVTPCPCTLDAHEGCMLQWIAETEASGGPRKKLRCPACNARIRVTEPWDPIVALGDKYGKVYGRASYFVLASTLMTMGVVGSGYYGLQSMMTFAGPRPTLNWLGLRKIITPNPREPPFSWRDGASLVWKFYLLNLIAPFLLFHRALPNLGDAAAVGVSCIYSFVLNFRKIPITWPPSPEWALTLLPYTSLAYSRAYYGLFGAFENRLNQALRGRNIPDAAAGDVQPPANGNGDVVGEEVAQRGGFVAHIWRLGVGIANFLRNDNDMVLDNGGAAAAFANGRGVEFQLELVVGQADVQEEIEENEELPQPFQNNQAPDAHGQDANAEPQALPPPDALRERPAEQALANGVEAAGDGNRLATPFSDIVTAMATQLLLPRISGITGQLLEYALPRAWVVRSPHRRPTGLLQEKWGRSLVGGCLFIVLRDALNLYMKYRRVQVKQHRKIQNIDRRRGKQGSDTEAH